MRTIKFRGFRTDGQGWVYGSLILDNHPEVKKSFIQFNSEINLFERFSVEVIPESVGQFTGLQDKKGVDIYEGDKTNYGVIMWNNEKALFTEHFYQEVTRKWSVSSYPISVDRMEVIGSIHTTPELLNPSNK